MIEQALYFALGVLVALLAGILVMPIVSRRAWRLARMRGGMSLGSTEARAANVDSEIAVRAVEIARLSHRLAVAEENALELRTAIGRRSVQDIAVKAHASDLERSIFEMRSEVDRIKAERADLKVAAAALQVALHDAFAQRDDARSRVTASQVRVGELMAEASRDRAKNAILSARAEELERLLRAAQAGQAKAAGAGAAFSNSLSPATKQRSLEPNARKDGERRLLLKPRLAATSAQDDARKGLQAEAQGFERRTLEVTNETGSRQASPLLLAARPEGESGGRPIRVAPLTLHELQGESEDLRARISAAADQKDTVDRAALRRSIVYFGRDVRLLFLARKAASDKTGAGRGA